MRFGPVPALSFFALAALGQPACQRAVPVEAFQIAVELVYVAGGGYDGQPEQSGVVGGVLPIAFTVEARDGRGDPVRGAVVHFEILEGQLAGDWLDPESTASGPDGQASNRYQLGQRAGANRLRIYAEGLEDRPLEFQPVGAPDAPASLVALAPPPATGILGQPLPEPVLVGVLDRFQNGVPGVAVQFSASDGGEASPEAAVTDGQGRASCAWTLGPPAALQTLTVSSGALEPLVLSCAASQGVPAVLEKVSGDHQLGSPGESLGSYLVVRVLDVHGNPVPGVPVTFQVVGGQADLTYMDESIYEEDTDLDGLASTTVTPRAYGQIQVEARAAGLPAVVFTATCTDATPRLSLVSPQSPAQAVVGGTLDLTLRVEDEQGTPMPAQMVMCFADAALGETAGDFPVDEVPSDAQGLAVLSMVLGPKAGPGLQWARCWLLAFPDDEVRLEVTGLPDAPAGLVALGGDGQSGPFGQPLPAPFVVLLQDRFGNPVPGWGVSWSSATGGVVTPNPSPTDGAGVAQATGRLGSDEGVPEQEFTAAANGHEATFHALGMGLLARALDPACLWPGFPDPAAPDPGSTLVPFRVLGAGFQAGDQVIWDAAGARQAIAPDQIQPGELRFSVAADHFLAGQGGELGVAVRSAAGAETAPLAFHLLRANPDSGQGPDQCTQLDAGAWSWVACNTIAPGAALYGQDGHHHPAASQPDYQAGPDAVLDRATGLVWARCPLGLAGASCSLGQLQAHTQVSARAACEALALDGADDWRLPEFAELFSLLDFGTQFPAADTGAFPGTPEGYLWTAAPYAPDAAEGHRVDFDAGGAEHVPVGEPDTYARCVRGGFPPGGARFSRSAATPAEPVVEDFQAGLVWQGCAAGRSGADCESGAPLALTWSDALAHCQGLTWAGRGGWRLPQVKELVSILELAFDWPAVDPVLFPRTPTNYAWSATSKVGIFTDWAWRVGMGDGYVAGASKGQTALTHVRCVRDMD